MNDHLSDEFLYMHIPRVESASIDLLPTGERLNHAFSGRFLRKMQALLKYERRGAFGRFAARFGQVVAAVLVVMILLNTVLVVSVEAYREKFFEIDQAVTEECTSFFVDMDNGAPVTELVPIEPPYIPKGFEIIDRFSDAIQNTVIYLNEDGQEIYYCQLMAGSGPMYFDTEDATVQTIQIAKHEVYVVAEDNVTQVYWIDNSCEFLLISNADFERILDVAESVINSNIS